MVFYDILISIQFRYNIVRQAYQCEERKPCCIHPNVNKNMYGLFKYQHSIVWWELYHFKNTFKYNIYT